MQPGLWGLEGLSNPPMPGEWLETQPGLDRPLPASESKARIPQGDAAKLRRPPAREPGSAVVKTVREGAGGAARRSFRCHTRLPSRGDPLVPTKLRALLWGAIKVTSLTPVASFRLGSSLILKIMK